MRTPDFFLVGAPKSGTTAMHHFLYQHPEIFMIKLRDSYGWNEGKELHFFGSDLFSNWRTKEKYLSFFSEARNEKRVGDTDVFYLYSKKASYEIKSFNPNSSIIIILRDPVEMIYSLHSQSIFGGVEDIISFEEALEAEEERKRGFRVPRNIKFSIEYLFYTEIAKYFEQVKRYFDIWGKEKVHVIIFEDQIKDMKGTYKSLLRFLEVDEEFTPNFEVINPNRRITSITVHKLLSRPSRINKMLFRTLIPNLSLRKRLKEFLWHLNIQYKKRLPLEKSLRKRLQEELKSDINKLENLLDRDLTHWKT